jgi:hypothetical protein
MFAGLLADCQSIEKAPDPAGPVVSFRLGFGHWKRAGIRPGDTKKFF